MAEIDQDRLDSITRLRKGIGPEPLPDEPFYGCVMQAVSYVTHADWVRYGTSPDSTSPICAQLAISLNDSAPTRRRLIALIPRLANSRSTPEVERARAELLRREGSPWWARFDLADPAGWNAVFDLLVEALDVA